MFKNPSSQPKKSIIYYQHLILLSTYSLYYNKQNKNSSVFIPGVSYLPTNSKSSIVIIIFKFSKNLHTSLPFLKRIKKSLSQLTGTNFFRFPRYHPDSDDRASATSLIHFSHQQPVLTCVRISQ